MSPLVIDASVALVWCFDDEARPQADHVLHAVRDDGATAPSLWRLEMANVLLAAERRGRIDRAGVDGRLHWLGELPVEIDDETGRHAWSSTLALARAEQLTLYDATYLELAMRRGAVLATLDGDLAEAARRVGVPLAL